MKQSAQGCGSGSGESAPGSARCTVHRTGHGAAAAAALMAAYARREPREDLVGARRPLVRGEGRLARQASGDLVQQREQAGHVLRDVDDVGVGCGIVMRSRSEAPPGSRRVASRRAALVRRGRMGARWRSGVPRRSSNAASRRVASTARSAETASARVAKGPSTSPLARIRGDPRLAGLVPLDDARPTRPDVPQGPEVDGVRVDGDHRPVRLDPIAFRGAHPADGLTADPDGRALDSAAWASALRRRRRPGRGWQRAPLQDHAHARGGLVDEGVAPVIGRSPRPALRGARSGGSAGGGAASAHPSATSSTTPSA